MASLALPSPRQEAWRWFPARAVETAAASVRGDAAEPAGLFLDLHGPRLLFVDGAYRAEASRPGDVRVEPLDLATDHPLGSRAAGGTGWRLALGRDRVPGPVQIVHVSTGGESHLPAEIALDADAAATVVETYAGAGWSNRLTRIRLARSARLMRAIRIEGAGFVSLRDEAVLATGASLVATVLGQGQGSRIDVAATLAGEGGFAEVGGALLATGAHAHEAAVVVRHEAPNCQSRQLWRLLAGQQATASAAARVEVARDAQKTDGEQSLRGLLLDRTATVNLKPELEIFADDVKCAHGATVGELDRGALFYLESRGIPPASAKALLARAFVADALGRIGDEAVRAAFVADADRWLDGAMA